MDEDLEPTPTMHGYIDEIFLATGMILAACRDLPVYDEIDMLTGRIDDILVTMRHANWIQVVG